MKKIVNVKTLLFKIDKKIYSPISLFSILILGLGLRAQEAISNNFLFLIDQGRDMLAVRDIVFNHKLTLIGPYTSLQGVFQGPLWYYLLSIPIVITDGDPRGGIFLMLILSVSVLFVVYFFMKKLFGERAAIITIFLFAVSPEAAAAATYAWNPHPMWLLIILYVFSFYALISKRIRFNWIVWPLISLMFHFETALAVFILLASLLYVLVFDRKLILNRDFVIGIFLFFIFFLPQVLFDVRHNFLMSKSILSLFSGSKQGLFVTNEYKGYFNLLIEHIYAFYNNFKSSFVRVGHFQYLPDMFAVLIIFIAIFIKKIKIFDEGEKKFFVLILRLVLITISLSFIFPFPIRYWYLTGFQSFYLLPLGLILSKFECSKFTKVLLLLFFTLSIFYGLKRLDTLYIHQPDDGGIAKIKGKIAAIDYIYKDAKDSRFGLLTFTPPVYTYAYDYLIWWHGGRRYNYKPYHATHGLFYLLIETDPSKPWSYKGWLETVIKTGTVLETKELPSGFIIQKRIEEKKNAI